VGTVLPQRRIDLKNVEIALGGKVSWQMLKHQSDYCALLSIIYQECFGLQKFMGSFKILIQLSLDNAVLCSFSYWES
jgi:hypothetical protein